MINRKNFLMTVTLAAAALLPAQSVLAQASEYGSREEAKAMVKRAVAHIKAKGPEAAYAEFLSDPVWKDRDLYVSVWDMKGNCLVHGGNPKIVGRNMWGLKDQNGVEIIKMQTELALSKGEGWSDDFVFLNPVTKKLQPKQTFVQRVSDTWVAIGFYK